MRSLKPSLLSALLALSAPLFGQDPPTDEAAPGDGNGAKPAAPVVPGFVHVPEGPVRPGCDLNDYKQRHRGNEELRKTLLYEVWGAVPPFTLPAFYMGKHDVTNAQWKAYMDRELRVTHKTTKGETLKQIAEQYVQFGGEGMSSEWKALYALNWRVLVEAWKNDAQPAKEGEEAKPATWNPAWQVEDPPDLSLIALPAGIELTFYRRRVPRSWYGWCKLSGLRLDGEYCDPRKPAAEAFRVPEEPPFTALKLRAKDFARYPVRDISPRDQLEFAEWCGCHLSSEYEYERAVAGDQVQNQFTFGAWSHNAQKNLFAWADNPRVQIGGEAPFPVDDAECEKSATPSGIRMLHGNTWKLTRTFFDIHPRVKPAPPPPDPNLNNYALIAKGGSYGDGWHLMQRSVRADKIGNTAWLTLDTPNRADTLGVRLVRHPQPGQDLLMHSVLGLTYDTGRALWIEPTLIPLSFDYARMAGVEHFHAAPAEAPYIHFERPAETVAFVPLHFTELDDKMVRDSKSAWGRGKAESGSFAVLGALRGDVPFAGGRRLTETEAEKLRDERRKYDEKMKIWKGLPPAKRKNLVEPEKPADYEPDEYEKLTEKNSETCGLWRNGTIKAGAYYVVYWNGFIGLANKARTMPPDLIFAIEDPSAAVKRNRRAANDGLAPSTLGLDEAKDRIRLTFEVEEQVADVKKKKRPPPAAESSLWALCEVQPELWTGGTKAAGQVWAFDVTLTVPSGTLKAWNETKGNPRRSATLDRQGEPVEEGPKLPGTSEDKKEDDPK